MTYRKGIERIDYIRAIPGKDCALYAPITAGKPLWTPVQLELLLMGGRDHRAASRNRDQSVSHSFSATRTGSVQLDSPSRGMNASSFLQPW